MKQLKKEMFFSQLQSLLSAGLDFNRSFELLIECEYDKNISALLKQIHSTVLQGDTLWYALQITGQFSRLDYGVIRIGEETGQLTKTLSFLSEYYNKQIARKKMITSALSYPLIIILTALLVVVFMVLFVVPMFEQVYTRMGSELPQLTLYIITLSKILPTLFLIFFFIIGALSVIIYINRNNEFIQKKCSEILLNLPLIGIIIKLNYQCSFCKLLHLLTVSGVPLLHGVELLSEIITFYHYKYSFIEITSSLERGESFAYAMEKVKRLYSKKLLMLLKVGEESNKLPFMLNRQGEELSAQLEYKLKLLGTMLEPILIILIGLFVAIILIAMYLPMFKLGGVIQ